jgi:hypothetical protein
MYIEANITDDAAAATSCFRLGNPLLSKESRSRHIESLYLHPCRHRGEQVNWTFQEYLLLHKWSFEN